MIDKTSNLTFGPCSRCHNTVTGHAVYLNGVLLCGWCELDIAMSLSGYKDLDKVI